MKRNIYCQLLRAGAPKWKNQAVWKICPALELDLFRCFYCIPALNKSNIYFRESILYATTLLEANTHWTFNLVMSIIRWRLFVGWEMETDNIDEFFRHYCFSCHETVFVSVIFWTLWPATCLHCVANDCYCYYWWVQWVAEGTGLDLSSLPSATW